MKKSLLVLTLLALLGVMPALCYAVETPQAQGEQGEYARKKMKKERKVKRDKKERKGNKEERHFKNQENAAGMYNQAREHARTPEERHAVRTFSVCDEKNAGKLSKEAYKKCFPENTADETFTAIDQDGDGHISMHEHRAHYSKRQ